MISRFLFRPSISISLGKPFIRYLGESSHTLFEKIAAKEIPSKLLYEDDQVFDFIIEQLVLCFS